MTRGDDYVLGRGLADSVRLDAQHLLWKMHKGYELHPLIPRTDNMKIAEIGTGTGIWLFDIARQLPSSVQLHGFDISDNQYPSKELWPKNVSLGLLNSLIDPPAHLVGQYDVVHLRMWVPNIRGNDTSALIQHVKSLLKPGGYIQWEDADLVHQYVKGPKAQEFERRINKIFDKAGLDFRWVSDIPDRLTEKGFLVLESESGRFELDSIQECTKTYLLVLREYINGFKKLPDLDIQQMAKEEEIALDQLYLQYSHGIVYNWSPVSLLGRRDD
ncbi:hypothetical protein N7456_002748 [Penicillium angulare]|uniref:Methyltransferase domain-containing protein n=1 Tax=Penicillium angulare TaxID=116970 RepID=A0A9W9G937_9EURO|nr:hypothetical protein N7456_002748 [Penicillium angulare]